MGFTENTRLSELYHAESLKPIQDCLISGGHFFEENGSLTLAEVQKQNRGECNRWRNEKTKRTIWSWKV